MIHIHPKIAMMGSEDDPILDGLFEPYELWVYATRDSHLKLIKAPTWKIIRQDPEMKMLKQWIDRVMFERYNTLQIRQNHRVIKEWRSYREYREYCLDDNVNT